MVIGGWGLGIRPRSCGPDAGRGRDAYARIGGWGSFYSRKGRKGREGVQSLPSGLSVSVRGMFSFRDTGGQVAKGEGLGRTKTERTDCRQV